MAGIAGEHFMARTGAEILIGKTADLPDPRPERGETFAFEASANIWEPQTRLRERQDWQQCDEPGEDIER